MKWQFDLNKWFCIYLRIVHTHAGFVRNKRHLVDKCLIYRTLILPTVQESKINIYLFVINSRDKSFVCVIKHTAYDLKMYKININANTN